VNLTDLEPTLLPHTASVLPTVNREPRTLNHAKIQPGSQDFAAGGGIELAYHRIQQTSGELNWSRHVELLPVLGEISPARHVIFEKSERKLLDVRF